MAACPSTTSEGSPAAKFFRWFIPAQKVYQVDSGSERIKLEIWPETLVLPKQSFS